MRTQQPFQDLAACKKTRCNLSKNNKIIVEVTLMFASNASSKSVQYVNIRIEWTVLKITKVNDSGGWTPIFSDQLCSFLSEYETNRPPNPVIVSLTIHSELVHTLLPEQLKVDIFT